MRSWRFFHLFGFLKIVLSNRLAPSFYLLAAICLVCCSAEAATVNLAWLPNNEANLAGYRLHIGTSSGSYTSTVDLGKITSYQVQGLEYGRTYYFALKAFNAEALQSAFSQEVSTTLIAPDTTPPQIGSVSAPALSESKEFVVGYTNVIDPSGLSEVQLWVRINNQSWVNSGQTRATTNGSFSYTAINDGTYYFAVVAKDTLGNTTSAPSGVGHATTIVDTSIDDDQPEEEIVPPPATIPPPSDLCPDDPKKTAPGSCGCGVAEDNSDLDGDAVINCLDDDIDGDGVGNEQELLDGTNPFDPGSVQSVVGTKICTEWNGFLEKLWNIIELVNVSSNDLKIEVSLLNSRGVLVQRGMTDVAAGAQQDLLIHDFSGRNTNEYGMFCLSHSGSAGDLDGRMVYYKGALFPSTDNQFDFAFAMPFSNGLQGSQYVTFNTYQPSFNPLDQENLVANWIQLTNLSPKQERGKLTFYGMNGEVLGNEEVVITANQRIDFSGHRFGRNQVGHVAWLPESKRANFQMRNVRYLYDNPGTINSFATAFQLEGAHPSGELLTVPVDLQEKIGVVEIVNTANQYNSVTVSIYNHDGVLKNQSKIMLSPNNSRHLIINELMKGETKGIVTVKGSRNGSVVAVGMHYQRDDSGSISNMYGMLAKQATGISFKNSYNTFLNQTSVLIISNSSSKNQRVNYSLVSSNGVRIASGMQITVPARGMREVVINDFTPADQYGLVELQTQQSSSIVSWVNRVRGEEYVMPTPSR